MGSKELTPKLLGLIAERFRILAEPARLQLMNVLRDGERTVSELVEATSLVTVVGEIPCNPEAWVDYGPDTANG